MRGFRARNEQEEGHDARVRTRDRNDHRDRARDDIRADVRAGNRSRGGSRSRARLGQRASATAGRRPGAHRALRRAHRGLLADLDTLGFVPVPITLQTFAVLLAGAALGATRGFLAVLLYLAIGFIGLPVFAGGSAGLAVLALPSAGFLLSFPFAAWLAGFAVSRLSRRSAAGQAALVFVALIPASLLIYAAGIPVMSWLAGITLGQALVFNLAFVPLDLVKMALVAIVATAVHRAFPDLLPPRASREAPRSARRDARASA
ncbi:biotin transporter BioY [Leucobacter soli]|uniref:biotin transporter BioY n=1 Tax=Leucobacter soli TaxID=2812850 RepID=UPI00360B2885